MELKDATEETVAQVTQRLSENVSNTINGQLNKYFPKNEQQGTTTTQDGGGKTAAWGRPLSSPTRTTSGSSSSWN